MGGVKATTCEIYSVVCKNAYRWKWRYVDAGGRNVDCTEEYKVFFDCVRAARASGYAPRASWVRGAVFAENSVRAHPRSALHQARDIDLIIHGLRASCRTIRSIWLVVDCADVSVHAARLYSWDLVALAQPLSMHRPRKAYSVRRRDIRLRVLGAGNRLEETSAWHDSRHAAAIASEWQECNPGEGYYVESSGAGETRKRTRRRAICLWPGADPLGGPGA